MSRCERGSITPLVVGLAVIVVLLVAVVVDASAAYLRREGLNSLADSAALAATDGLGVESIYLDGLGEELTVDSATARRLVERYLRQVRAADRYDDLSWAVSIQGRDVVVRLRATMALPLHLPGIGRRTAITAGSSATLVVGD